MYSTISDDRYFIQGVDNNLLESTPLYSAAEYESQYPLMLLLMPRMFSLNLGNEITQFLTMAPPAFDVSIHEVIDTACFFYSDWDSIIAVADEFISDQALHSLRRSLELANYPPADLEKEHERQLIMLSDALRYFMDILIGALSRYNVPAIEDFGSAYRLDNIDSFGNVFFKITDPEIVYNVIEENTHATYRATLQHKELSGG